MADVPTTTVNQSDTVQLAYNKAADMALRPHLHFGQVATTKATKQSMRGHSVDFTFYADLGIAATPLQETVDVEAVPLSDSHITVALEEYGNSVLTTARVRGMSYQEIDMVAANVIGWNAGITFDELARDAIYGGTNVQYANNVANRAAVDVANVLNAHSIRQARARLEGDNVLPNAGSSYTGFIHPDQSVDLREETGAASWVEPSNYSAAEKRWNGEIGTFEGVKFIVTPRVPVYADAGNGNTDVYAALIIGQQALACAYSSKVSGTHPQVVVGPIVDRLRRFRPIGWYWLGGFGIYRQESSQKIETASSIGDNA